MTRQQTHQRTGRAAALVSVFPGGIAGPSQRRPILREGLRLGRAHWPFRGDCPDRTLAPLHAELRWVGEAVVLRALPGSRLNGEALVGARTLSHGDVLRCGESLFVFVADLDDPPLVPGPTLGDSVAMRTIRRRIGLVAARPQPVVVTGERGTGKALIARLLHEESGRRGPFVAIGCGALSPTHVASDLFGHVRGAFGGALTDEVGLFRAADGGTLLLDELSELPISLQPALLRVLDDQRSVPSALSGRWRSTFAWWRPPAGIRPRSSARAASAPTSSPDWPSGPWCWRRCATGVTTSPN